MRKKKQYKKRQEVDSDASEYNSFLDGSTTPKSYTGSGKTHQDGEYMGAESTQSTRHRSIVNQASVKPVSQWSNSRRSTSHRAINHRSIRHGSTSHRSSDSKYQAPVTSNKSSSHLSSISDHHAPGTSTRHLITRHQSPVN